MTQRICRCEARISAAILDGYACGNPECWRTAERAESFDAFVAELVQRREADVPRPKTPDAS